MQFKRWMEERKLGNRLIDPYKSVVIFRAVHHTVKEIKNKDYVTRSKKFAIEHAQHQIAVEEEPYIVLRALVPTENVYEASNPGEYFYIGPNVQGKIVPLT